MPMVGVSFLRVPQDVGRAKGGDRRGFASIRGKISFSPLQNTAKSCIILNWHFLAPRDAAAPYVHEEVKSMNKYELVYVIDVALEDEARKAVIDRFNGMIEQNGGKVLKVDEWGKRRLAYPINYKTEGYYLLVNFESEATLPREIERNLQIAESVLRYLIVKVEEKRSNVKPRPVRVAPVEEAAPAAEAPAEAEAPAAPAEAE